MRRNNEDPAILEERRSFVDSCMRRGWSPYDIAKQLASDPDKEHLIHAVKSQLKEGDEGKLTFLVRTKLVRHDIEAVKIRFRRDVSPTQAEDALAEYVARLDSLYAEMYREAADAPDHRDKIAALRVAVEIAEKKALALGVDLEPKVTEGLGRLGAGVGLVLTELVHAANGKMALPGTPKALPSPAAEDIIDGEFSEGDERVEAAS